MIVVNIYKEGKLITIDGWLLVRKDEYGNLRSSLEVEQQREEMKV